MRLLLTGIGETIGPLIRLVATMAERGSFGLRCDERLRVCFDIRIDIVSVLGLSSYILNR